MSDPTARKPEKGPGRGVKIALAISLALNLAVAGLIAGFLLGGERGGGPPRLNVFGLGPFAFAMERDDRLALRNALRDADLAEERRAIGGTFRAIQAALRAEPFDRDAVADALVESRVLVERLQAAGHGAFLDRLEQMSAAERVELADALARMMRRRGDGP